MNRTAESARVLCVDLAKNKFQMNVYSATGGRLRQHTLTRARVDATLLNPQPGDLVVMEACGSSNYWGRRLLQRGFRVKLVPPQFVAKQRIGNKNDGNDADAIFAAHRDPRVRPVPVKTTAQQDLSALHRVRQLLVRQRTQYTNQVRGLLAERGCVAPPGEKGFAELLARATPSDEVTPALLDLIGVLREQIAQLDRQLRELDRRMRAALRSSPVAQRLDTILGLATVTSTAFAAEYGHGVERFADARQFAASLGVTPSEHSSGQTRRLGPMTRRGDDYLRVLLTQCSQSVIKASSRRDDPICRLVRRLMAQGKPHNVIVGAVCNRLARIIYAVLKHGTTYQGAALLKAAA